MMTKEELLSEQVKQLEKLIELQKLSIKNLEVDRPCNCNGHQNVSGRQILGQQPQWNTYSSGPLTTNTQSNMQQNDSSRDIPPA